MVMSVVLHYIHVQYDFQSCKIFEFLLNLFLFLRKTKAESWNYKFQFNKNNYYSSVCAEIILSFQLAV